LDSGQLPNTGHNDGWHRLARAKQDGVHKLPVIVLDEDQEHEARIFGGDKGQPYIR
jgi:hypothetical protein